MGVVTWLVVGGLIGWAASLLWHDLEGVVVNALVGMVGAFVGGWLLVPTVADGTAGFSLAGVAVSLLGAVALLALVNLVRLGTTR